MSQFGIVYRIDSDNKMTIKIFENMHLANSFVSSENSEVRFHADDYRYGYWRALKYVEIERIKEQDFQIINNSMGWQYGKK